MVQVRGHRRVSLGGPWTCAQGIFVRGQPNGLGKPGRKRRAADVGLDLKDPRPGILEVEPYIGGAALAAGFAEPIRLASNENPLGASPRAAEAYAAVASDLHHYPDGAAVELREAIAACHGLDAERIVCGAGSDEVLPSVVFAALTTRFTVISASVMVTSSRVALIVHSISPMP